MFSRPATARGAHMHACDASLLCQAPVWPCGSVVELYTLWSASVELADSLLQRYLPGPIRCFKKAQYLVLSACRITATVVYVGISPSSLFYSLDY